MQSAPDTRKGDNIAQLSHINYPSLLMSLLFFLRERYQTAKEGHNANASASSTELCFQIYTNAGDSTVVALNPYANLDDLLFTEDLRRLSYYRDDAYRATAKPHVYHTFGKAYSG